MIYALLTCGIICSVLLYTLLKKWYIVPLENLRKEYDLFCKASESILKSKNDLINRLSMENAELLRQVKPLKKKSTKKSVKSSTKKKILEKFDIKSVK